MSQAQDKNNPRDDTIITNLNRYQCEIRAHGIYTSRWVHKEYELAILGILTFVKWHQPLHNPEYTI